ncbi:hypothetical protein KDW99_06635 [Marinomonas rhizomae]|uniref:hypothetical protein n=1 Tax=Marinomonas rhizomae TaxID=491948 RepID=UPI00210284A0|nr:hypothetical protein [Marinomonas rhizomae]UTW00796.1 hypothetical protein KDW99_06635 [Marinomonas rhizomae]
MEIFNKSVSFQLTELWFKWLGWLSVCAILNISKEKLDSQLIGVVYWISMLLVAYSIGSTCMDMCLKLTKNKESKIVHAFLQVMIILNSLFLAFFAYTITEMVKARL